jgi:hypothetical protein
MHDGNTSVSPYVVTRSLHAQLISNVFNGEIIIKYESEWRESSSDEVSGSHCSEGDDVGS